MINIIVDIDGTIADHSHRTALLESRCKACGSISLSEHRCTHCNSDLLVYTNESFQKFLSPELMAMDIPVFSAQRVISLALREPKRYTVHYLTGRKDREHRDVTTTWLSSYFEFDAKVSTISMRTPNESSMRPSDYKENKFANLKKNLSLDGTFIFFEDDPYVQGMYAKHGLVIQGPEGWSTFMPKGMNRLTEKQLSR